MISLLLCGWPPRNMKKGSHHYSFYPAKHLYAHVTWRMSSSAEVNLDLNKKENGLQTQTSQKPQSSTTPLATLNHLRVSTNKNKSLFLQYNTQNTEGPNLWEEGLLLQGRTVFVWKQSVFCKNASFKCQSKGVNPTAPKEATAPVGCRHKRMSKIVFGWYDSYVS